MALWAFWRHSARGAMDAVLRAWCGSGEVLQVEPFGLLLMDGHWSKDAALEVGVLLKLLQVAPVESVRRAVPHVICAAGHGMVAQHPGLSKIARLLAEVGAVAASGPPAAVLVACEAFARHKGQWLKVAGDEKAEILGSCFRSHPPALSEAILEFGAFVGYTAVRLCDALGSQRGSCGLVSLEVSPVHVCVARHLLDLALLSHRAEVRAGQAKDVLPHTTEELGALACGFAFMDHRGTIFHQDFALLEALGLFSPSPCFIADNALNPGSPVFLWRRAVCHDTPSIGRGEGWATEAWSLTEFSTAHEDWMSVTRRPRV